MTTEFTTGWARTSLDSICLPVRKTDPRSFPDLEFEYVDIGGISPGSGRIQATKSLKGAEAPSRARQVVHAGDIVLSTVRTYQRKTAIVPAELHGAVASTGFSVLRSALGVDSRFLLFQLLSHEFVSQLNPQQTGTSYPAVRDSDVRAMSILIAPTAEQGRIVAAIEEHFSRLDAADDSVAVLSLRTAQLLESVLQTELRTAQSNSQPLRDFLTEPLANGRSVPTAEDYGFPVLRLTCLRDGQIDTSETKQGNFGEVDYRRYQVQSGDFLISRGNGSLHLVGIGGLVPRGTHSVAYPDTLIRARVDRSRLRPEFLSLIWNSRVIRRQLESQARTTAGIYKVNQSMIGNVLLPVPSPDVQDRIAHRLELVRQTVLRLDAKVDRYHVRSKTLRRSILSMAFSGQLVPQDPADEPASVLLERISASRRAALKYPKSSA